MGLFARKKVDPAAPRGYCEECGAALVDCGVIDVPIDPMRRFDAKTGRLLGTRKWRNWECPNKEFVTVKVGNIAIPRGWVHSSYTDYDVETEGAHAV